MNGADDCPSSLSQRLHEGNNLEAGRAVQTTGSRVRQKFTERDVLFSLDLYWDDLHSEWASDVLPGGLIEEHDRRIVDQLECNGQSFTLAPRKRVGACLSTLLKTKSSQDLIHLSHKTKEWIWVHHDAHIWRWEKRTKSSILVYMILCHIIEIYCDVT